MISLSANAEIGSLSTVLGSFVSFPLVSHMLLLYRGSNDFFGIPSFAAVVAFCHPSVSPSVVPRRILLMRAPSTVHYSCNRMKMATASKVQLSLDACGVFHVPGVTKEAVAKASEVLQENHEIHHIFFNKEGFHSRWPMLSSVSRCSTELFEVAFLASSWSLLFPIAHSLISEKLPRGLPERHRITLGV